MKSFCLNCGDLVEPILKSTKTAHEVRGIKFECLELKAYCKECSEEIYISFVHDFNVDICQEAYNEARIALENKE